MMKPMFELPSEENVEKIIITAGFVRGEEELKRIYRAE
jgi:ATP-dependent Clp protease ATP-binding subunit ClpX